MNNKEMFDDWIELLEEGSETYRGMSLTDKDCKELLTLLKNTQEMKPMENEQENEQEMDRTDEIVLKMVNDELQTVPENELFALTVALFCTNIRSGTLTMKHFKEIIEAHKGCEKDV